MASANFRAYDRTLRRLYMMNLVESLARERGGGFRASLVVNARTGLPAMPEPAEHLPPRSPGGARPHAQLADRHAAS